LAFANISDERLSTVWLRCVWLTIVRGELRQPRVRARCVVRRIGHSEDDFVHPPRETFLLAEFRVLQLFGQKLQEVFAPSIVAGEDLSEALDGARCGMGAEV